MHVLVTIRELVAFDFADHHPRTLLMASYVE